MLKKQIRTLGHKAIVKENKSHQEAFDEISQTPGVDLKLLADELSKIPSSGKQKATAGLRYTFMGALLVLGGYRVLGIVLLMTDGLPNIGFIAFIILLSIFVPVVGIYASLTRRVEHYTTTGILLGIAVFRSVSKGEIHVDINSLFYLLPVVIAFGLAFYIPTKLKTPYKRMVTNHFSDGKTQEKVSYYFEDTRFDGMDVLDRQF